MAEMTRREIEKAISAKRDTYPGNTECAICGELWYAHNGELCPKCSICGHHALRHVVAIGQAIEVIELRESSDYVWTICRGGTTTFLPRLDGDFSQ